MFTTHFTENKDAAQNFVRTGMRTRADEDDEDHDEDYADGDDDDDDQFGHAKRAYIGI